MYDPVHGIWSEHFTTFAESSPCGQTIFYRPNSNKNYLFPPPWVTPLAYAFARYTDTVNNAKWPSS